jgi:hypothetical protein
MQGTVVPRLSAHGTLLRPCGSQAPFLATQSLAHAPPLLKAVKDLGLGADEVRSVAAAAWSTLKAVHDLGVVHNSIHEGNLLLEYAPGPGGKCTVWLIDFQRAILSQSSMVLRLSAVDVNAMHNLLGAEVMWNDTKFNFAMQYDVGSLVEMLEVMANGMPGLDDGTLDELWDDVVVRMHDEVYDAD